LGALALGSLAASLLAACTLAPAYKPPAAEPVAQYKEAGDWVPAQPADAQERGSWWEVFSDPKLNELEKQLDTSNPHRPRAVARFQQARAIAREDVSNEFPTVDFGASGTRTRSSGNAPLNTLFGHRPVTGNDFVTSLNLNWEVDLFGRLRSQAAAARAQAQS